MTLDPALLAQAKADAARVAAAEQQAQLARGEYFSAVRKLHLAGAPLREIASALGVSHQRVQQMVQTAGGSWWQRLRGRQVDPAPICSFCDRPPSEVSKLVAGPAVYICDGCIARAEQVIASGRPLADLHVDDNPRSRCSFCNLRRTKVPAMVAGPAWLCSECLRLCREIIDGRAG